QILFAANEYDAAIILQYLAAKVSFLPWYPAVDTVVIKGKVNTETESQGIYINNIIALGNGVYQIPVYSTSTNNDALALKANINGEIIDVIPNNTNTLTSFGTNIAVFASGDKLDKNQPVGYINARINGNILDLTQIRVNNVEFPNQSYKLNTNEDNNSLSIVNTPNPVTNNITSFIVNVPKKGTYSINIYDEFGREVSNVCTREFDNNQITSISWNTNNLAAGVYFYRLHGEGVNFVGKMIIK
nr:T9SS type A sorting domain-containing protein [Candidatus Kapabacteria bacterium]